MNPSLYPLLSASAALAALTGQRIYPVTAPQDVAKPYVVWTPVGVSTEIYLANPEDVDYDRVSVDCWALDYPAANAIAKAARAALQGHGYLVAGFTDYEPDTKLHRVTFDWSLISV